MTRPRATIRCPACGTSVVRLHWRTRTVSFLGLVEWESKPIYYRLSPCGHRVSVRWVADHTTEGTEGVAA